MSFFLLENEQGETLEAAFAFIESCSDDSYSNEEGAASDHSSGSERSSWSPFAPYPTRSECLNASSVDNSSSRSGNRFDHPPVSPQLQRRSQQQQTQAEQTQTNRSRAANTKAVNQYRNRTKAQLLDLREKVLQMGARVEQLRKRKAMVTRSEAGETSADARNEERSGSAGPDDSSSMGLDLAVVEYRRLQESQALNRKLKEALAKQTKMNKVIETFFQRQFARNVRATDLTVTIHFGSNILLCLTSRFDQDLSSVLQSEKKQQRVFLHDDALIFRELFHYMEEEMHSTTVKATASINVSDTTCAFSNTFVKQDPILGQVFEFTTNTPLPCSRQQLESSLWAHLMGFDERRPSPHVRSLLHLCVRCSARK